MAASGRDQTDIAGLPGAVSLAERRRLQQRYEQACEAARRRPPDEAAAAVGLLACLRRDPGNLVYVDTTLRLLGARPARSGRLGRWWGDVVTLPARRRLRRLVADQRWADVLPLALQLLVRRPRSVDVLGALARVSEAGGWPAAELRYREAALAVQRSDAPLREYARALTRQGLFERALAAWRQLAAMADEVDDETQGMIERLTGHALPGDAADASTPAAHAAGGDVSSEAGDRAEPQTVERYLELAARQRNIGQYAQAEATLARARNRSPGDLRIVERLEELAIARARHDYELAVQQAASERTEAARELAEQLRHDWERVELDVWDRRCQRHPARRAWRLELARRLKRLGRPGPALEQLEVAIDDADCAAAALLEKGECLQQLQLFAAALEAYQASLAADQPADLATRARTLYQAARLAEAMGQRREAEGYIGQLRQLAHDDAEAASRLDKLLANRHKG